MTFDGGHLLLIFVLIVYISDQYIKHKIRTNKHKLIVYKFDILNFKIIIIKKPWN